MKTVTVGVVLLLVTTACGFPDPALLRPGSPVPRGPEQEEAAARDLGERLVEALNNRYVRGCDSLWDFARLFEKAAVGLPADAAKISAARKAVLEQYGLGKSLCRSLGANGRADLVGIRLREGKRHIVTRMFLLDGTATFVEFVVEQGDGVRVTDLYSYANGEYVSADLRRSLLRNLAADPAFSRDLRSRELLAEDEALFVERIAAIDELDRLAEEGLPGTALTAYDSLPSVLRETRYFLIRRIALAEKYSEKECLAAVSALLESIDDPRLEFMVIDHLMALRRYDRANQALRTVRKEIGDDAHFLVLEGAILNLSGEPDLAAAKMREAFDKEPNLEMPLKYFFRHALKETNYEVACNIVRRLTALGYLLDEFEKDDDYKTFLASSEYAEWVTTRSPQWEREPLSHEAGISPLLARELYRTRIIRKGTVGDDETPSPPADIFRLVRYPTTAGELAGYLTPDPGDGKKRPAVVWAHGGFGGIGRWLWEQPHATDSFREKGFVVFCPSWRGENDNPGIFELFFGEVDDAVAAVEFVAQQPHVDPQRIYFAGHSTGGTLTLLAAESTGKIRAAFAFGGATDLEPIVADGQGYGNTPYHFLSKDESYYRSPIHFVGALDAPTFYFEGAASPYVSGAKVMEKRAQAAQASFSLYIVERGDHVSVLAPLSALIAEKIQGDTGDTCNIRFSPREVQQAFYDSTK